MKAVGFFLFILAYHSFSFCQTLSAVEFNTSLSAVEYPILLDVRTPGEFQKGHIKQAININWNDSTFLANITKFPKDSTVYVYCLSGGRSGLAAQKLREIGYKKVIELQGGMLKWRENNLPEVGISNNNLGLSQEKFNALISTNQSILVSFYADWCAPCKKMKPTLNEIEQEFNQVKLLRLNADEQAVLCKTLGISALPVLQLYKNGKIIWSNQGYMDKSELIQVLKNNQ